MRGFDDAFYAPHSRHTEIPMEQVESDERLTILADSKEAGLFLCMAQEGRQIFVMGHPEYDRMTLDAEYKTGFEQRSCDIRDAGELLSGQRSQIRNRN